MNSTTGGFAGIRVLHKAVDVLEALRGEASGLALSDLAKSVGMPKPTVYRIVATLKSRGYLEDGAAGAYRISRKLLQPLREESPEQALLRAARPAIADPLRPARRRAISECWMAARCWSSRLRRARFRCACLPR